MSRRGHRKGKGVRGEGGGERGAGRGERGEGKGGWSTGCSPRITPLRPKRLAIAEVVQERPALFLEDHLAEGAGAVLHAIRQLAIAVRHPGSARLLADVLERAFLDAIVLLAHPPLVRRQLCRRAVPCELVPARLALV